MEPGARNASFASYNQPKNRVNASVTTYENTSIS
jgi:hypothetical protein